MIHLYRSTQFEEWFSHSAYCYCQIGNIDAEIEFDKSIVYRWVNIEEKLEAMIKIVKEVKNV